jgi:predicted glycosyltransferase
MAAGRGEERRARSIAVDLVASARRTRRLMVSGGGEIGKQAVVLDAVQHAVALWSQRCGRGSAVAVEQVVAMRARRVSSRMDGETAMCG